MLVMMAPSPSGHKLFCLPQAKLTSLFFELFKVYCIDVKWEPETVVACLDQINKQNISKTGSPHPELVDVVS